MKQRDTILIVDDNELNRTILIGLFEEEYRLLEAENGEQAMLLLEQHHDRIAIMLLDVVMPVKDGYQVLEEIRHNGLLDEIPVVIITADNSIEGELRAFDLGASDIIVKPFEPHVVNRRVRNIIELFLHKHNLEEMVEEQAAKLRESNEVLIDALSATIEYRSLESGQHVRRIRMLTQVLLEEVRQNCPEYNLEPEQIAVMASASAMHDIGKIAIPDSILNKPGRLTSEEFEIMKTHSLKGCEILSNLERMNDKEYLRYAYSICRYHHERWDGKGYPDGLKGDAIPIWCQATGLADAYDALTSDRVYKKAIAHERAVNMILNGECGSFSPKLLECFKNAQLRLSELARRYADDINAAKNIPDPPALPALPGKETSLLQMEQMKYYAMLRYVDATVAEVDLATGSCHLVYLPQTFVRTFYRGDPLEKLFGRYVHELVHPDDAESVWRIWKEELPLLFEHGLFKQSWRHRIYDPVAKDWRWYQVTALRLDIEHPHQRKALILWREEDDRPVQATEINDGAILRNLLGEVFICRSDSGYTLLRTDSKLLGYSREELAEQFGNHFWEIILPKDRERVKKQLNEQLSAGTGYEIEFRVVTQEGKISWVLCHGRRIYDAKGRELLYNVLIDIDHIKHF